MNINYLFKHCTDEEKRLAESYVETKREQLEKVIIPHDAAASVLDVKIERLAKKHAYKVTLILSWPHEDLYAFEDDHTIAEAIDFAKDKLVEQIKKTYDRLRSRKDPHHKDVHVKEWHGVEEWTSERPDITHEAFVERVQTLLDPLRRHLTREIGYGVMEGALPEGAIRPEAIIADTLVDIHGSLRDRPDDRTLEQWFWGRALTMLKERIRNRAKNQATRVSLERQLKEEPRDKAIVGPIEEKLDMWQPDDDLKFEQFVAEEQLYDPSAERSKEELLRDLATWTRTLPTSWRETLLLHVFQQFSFEKIAAIQGRPLEVVAKDFSDAKKYLKEQLEQ